MVFMSVIDLVELSVAETEAAKSEGFLEMKEQ